MSENVLPFPRRLPRQQVAPNAVIGMVIFVFTERMLFAGFVSAFTVTPTAFNTLVLLCSGVALYFAQRAFKQDPASARRPTLIALLLASFFVCFQGVEWMRLLREGLTLSSSNHGAFFYLIIGSHALHAVV